MASDSVTGVLEWERGSNSPRPVVKGGLSVSSRLSETLGWISPAGVEVRTELRAHGNPPSSLLFVVVKLGEMVLLDVALCVPTANIGGSDAVGRRLKDVQVTRARGSLWPTVESPTVDPAPHTVAVIEALCSALELTPAYNMLEAGKDALAAGRLLLSSAGFQRAARSTTAPVRARMGVEGDSSSDWPGWEFGA